MMPSYSASEPREICLTCSKLNKDPPELIYVGESASDYADHIGHLIILGKTVVLEPDPSQQKKIKGSDELGSAVTGDIPMITEWKKSGPPDP